MVEPICINIWKEGSSSSSWNGVTKIVTILVQDKGLEEVINKNVTPLRWPQPDVEEPETKILDLKIPPVHTYEITGLLHKTHQVLTTSSVSSGTPASIPVDNHNGFSNGDSITIASPDGATFESTTIASTPTGNSLSANLTNSYPDNSLVTVDLTTSPKADLIEIIRDKGICNLIYRGESYTIAFSKISFKDTTPIEEIYEVKISIFEGEELV